MSLEKVSLRILFIQFTNAAALPPLHHSAVTLATAGWEVHILGVRGRDVDALTFPIHERIRCFELAYCPPGWRQKLHYYRYFLWVLWHTICWRPHWIYASDLLICPIALALSFLPWLKTVYHEHDTPANNQASLFMRFLHWSRGKLARRATVCILPNQQRADYFIKKLRPKKALCVWNCPRKAEVADRRNGINGEGLRVFYQGSIVPARLPLTFLHALAELPKSVTLCVVGYETVGSSGYVSELRKTAAELGLEDRVAFLPAMPRQKLMQVASDFDVGIASMPIATSEFNLGRMVGASNKAFDYLARGLAVVVSDLPDWKQEYIDPGYAIGCDPADVRSIASALKSLLNNPQRVRAMGEAGRQRILFDWNYEEQFRPVFCLLHNGST